MAHKDFQSKNVIEFRYKLTSLHRGNEIFDFIRHYISLRVGIFHASHDKNKIVNRSNVKGDIAHS